MKKPKGTIATGQPKNKLHYSLFSFSWVIGLFIMMGISILYTLTVYQRLADYLETTDSETMEFLLGLGTFLFLCLMFTLVIVITRRITVKNPIMKILKATERIGAGDFSVRLPVKKRFRNEYDLIFENINMLARELAGMETLRKDFVSNVSHEFKAPLALIQSSGDILLQGGLSEEEQQRYAKNVTDAAARLASMVTNILKLNKIESRAILTNSETIDLSEALREAILLFEPTWTAKEIEVNTDLEENLLIRGDAELMALMWTNLLSNAFKFTPAGGTVTVEAAREGSRIRVSVADTGPGIPEAQQQRIFEKFYQGDTSHVTDGNGLGLALVKSVANLSGSIVSVESAPGKGSRFTVSLPG